MPPPGRNRSELTLPVHEPNYTWRAAAMAFLLLICLIVVAVLIALIFIQALPDPLPYRDPEPHVTSE